MSKRVHHQSTTEGGTPSAAVSSHVDPAGSATPGIATPVDAVYVTVGVEPDEASGEERASVTVASGARTAVGPATPPVAATEATEMAVLAASLSTTANCEAATVPALPAANSTVIDDGPAVSEANAPACVTVRSPE